MSRERTWLVSLRATAHGKPTCLAPSPASPSLNAQTVATRAPQDGAGHAMCHCADDSTRPDYEKRLRSEDSAIRVKTSQLARLIVTPIEGALWSTGSIYAYPPSGNQLHARKLRAERTGERIRSDR